MRTTIDVTPQLAISLNLRSRNPFSQPGEHINNPDKYVLKIRAVLRWHQTYQEKYINTHQNLLVTIPREERWFHIATTGRVV